MGRVAGRALADRDWNDRAMWVAPVAAVGLAILLGVLGLTSSSLGIYDSDIVAGGRPEGLVAGDVRPIRSDEWRFRTPWVLGRSERGFPDVLPGGVGAHDLSVTDLPGEPWEALVRPASVPHHLFPVRTAFAMEWWGLYAVLFCGLYALLAELTRRPAFAAAGGALVVLSPAVQWWTGPNACASFGYSSGAIALMVAASRTRRPRLQLALSALSGWAVAAWAAALYPPWQIGAAVVFVPVAVWGLIRRWRDHPEWREALRAVARAIAPAALVALVLTGAFVLANRTAFSLVADTVYPGQRVHESGGGVPLVRLLGAPFDYAAQRLGAAIVNGTNQSENASGLALFIPVGVAAYGAAAAGALRRRPSTMPFLCLLAAMGVVLTWMLLPVPAWLARVTPLTAAPPGRMLLTMNVAGAACATVLASLISRGDVLISRTVRVVSTAAFAAATAWAADGYVVDGVSLGVPRAMLVAVPVLVGTWLLLGRTPGWGLLVLVAFSVAQASGNNPIQRGLEPLTSNPLARAIEQIDADDGDDGAWITFDLPAQVTGTLVASGIDSVSGLSFYPDRDAWDVLDPTHAFEGVWNRYAHLEFKAGPPGVDTTMEVKQTDLIFITIDPCNRALRDLGVRYVVAPRGHIDRCGRSIMTVVYQGAELEIRELR